MKIIIPNHNQQEIKYTFHCLFDVFLGTDIEFETDDKNNNFIIECPNGNIEITNIFFDDDDLNRLYVKANIPEQIYQSEFLINKLSLPIVSLFGEAKLEKEGKGWIMNSDIISASFFMLSRWEEYVIRDRDYHNRFNSKHALAVKYDFIDRPIVNEYVEILWELIRSCGYNGERRQREYCITPTHDVDFSYKWNGPFSKLKTLGGKLVKGNIKGLINTLKFIIKGKDPYDTYEQLMDASERNGTKSHFFFMSGGNSSYDNNYEVKDHKTIKLINRIKNRNHHIGFHPSYNTFQDEVEFRVEKAKLEKAAGLKINTGRQHFLRFEIPTTWNIWNNNQMCWDSSMTYTDKSGFRSGVCFSYPVFDILNRKQMELHEKPLIVMDVTIVEHEGLNTKQMSTKLAKLKSEVKKYNGEFVFLWHNSSFNEGVWLKSSFEQLNILR